LGISGSFVGDLEVFPDSYNFLPSFYVLTLKNNFKRYLGWGWG